MIPCPCCKGEGVVSVDESVHLTPSQRRIFDALTKRPRTSSELVELLYADRADGGPDYAHTTVTVFIKQMRTKLRPHGMTIRNCRGRNETPYRLEPLGG